MKLKTFIHPLWMILLLSVVVDAYTNDIEEAEESEEEAFHYENNYDNLYQRKDKKPTISEDAIFLPHEKYCQYFYVFDGRESNVLGCAKGYRFDAQKLQCLKAKHVECGKRKKNVDSSEEKHVGRIKYKCPKWNGFFAHEYYCHLYYSCQSKKANLFMCPPGMLFDSKDGKCSYRGNVKCDKKVDPYKDDSEEEFVPDSGEELYQCPETSGVYPHPKHCNKFIRCWFNIGDVYVCPKNKLYDIDLAKCIEKEHVYCENRKDPYDNDDDEFLTLIDMFPDFKCHVNKGRFQHEDCSMFYECKLGDANLYKCPPGTLYDKNVKRCKKESEVKCDEDLLDERDDKFTCPAKEGTFKDEDNCGYYYKCKKGKAQHLKCEDGELFDTDWKSCNDEDEVTCGDRLLPGDDPEEEDEDENVVDPKPNYKCDKRHGRFTHEEICNYYYYCRDGKPSIRNCRKGQFYDSYRKRCYDEVDCGKRKPKEDIITSTPKPKEFVCPKQSGKFPHPRNCRLFYSCDNGKYRLKTCTGSKLYHEKWRSCAEEEHVTCGDRIHPDMDPDEPQDKVVDPNPKFKCEKNYGQFNHEEYCDWYYNCHDKKASVRECRRGKLYDAKRRKCVHAKDVDCQNRKKPEEREEKTTPTEITTTVTTPTPEFQCPKKEGHFPHERNCRQFYHCEKGKHHVHECPKDQLFDEHKWKCEHEKKATCGKRIHPDMYPDEPEDEIVDPNPDHKCYYVHRRYVHEKYCHLYYSCQDNKPTIRRCRKGKYYDWYWRKCYDAKDVKCEDRLEPGEKDWLTTVSEATTTTKTTKPSTPVSVEDTTKTEITSTLTTPTPEFRCPKNEGHFPHERNCRKWYHCEKGNHHVHECPKDQLFDEHKWKCEPEKKATCGNRIHPDMYPDEPEDEIVDQNPDHKCYYVHRRYVHEKYCHLYYSCQDNKPTIRRCPKGKYYDWYWRKCYDAKDVKCENRLEPGEDDYTSSTTTEAYTATESTKTEKTTTEKNDISSESPTSKSTTISDEITSTFEPETTTLSTPEDTRDETSTLESTTISQEASSTFEPQTSTLSTPKDTRDETSTLDSTMISQEASSTFEPATSTLSTPRDTRDESSTLESTTISQEASSTFEPETSTLSTPSTILELTSTVKQELSSTSPETTTLQTTPSAEDTPLTVEDTTFSTTKLTESTLDDISATSVVDIKTTAEPTTFIVSDTTHTETPTVKEEVTKQTQTETPVTTASHNPSITSTIPTIKVTEPTSGSTVSEKIPTLPPRTTVDEEENTDKIIDDKPEYNCGEKDGYNQHESYCHYYYSCKNNKPVLRECPEGQNFDVERGHCEDWYMVTCGDRLRPDEIDPTFENKLSTHYIEKPSTSLPKEVVTEEPITEAPFVCPSKDGIYPHEKHCNEYFHCVDGVSEKKKCPEGQLFDIEKEVCNDEEETNCGKRIHPEDDQNNKVVDPNPEFDCTKRHGCYTHDVFCKWYYYCHDKRPEVRECSGDKYFDSVRNKCLEWWMVVCDKMPEPPTTAAPTETEILTKGIEITQTTQDGREGTTTDSREGTTTDEGRSNETNTN